MWRCSPLSRAASIASADNVYAVFRIVRCSAAGVRVARLATFLPTAFFFRVVGRFATLLPTTPLVPGRGVGNNLSWSELKAEAPQSRAAKEQAAWSAFLGFLDAYQADLQIDLTEISADYRITSLCLKKPNDQ